MATQQIDVTLEEIRLASEFLYVHHQLTSFKESILKSEAETIELSWYDERIRLSRKEMLQIISNHLYENRNKLLRSTMIAVDIDTN